MADVVSRGRAGGASWPRVAARGAVAGLAGGVVFGLMMWMMGMLPMVGMLVGSDTAAAGAVVHLINSLIIGAIYGVVAALVGACSYGGGTFVGLVYGIAWWILGPLFLMPIILGMGPQWGSAFTSMNLMSLIGHIVYGVITGLVFAYLSRSH